MSDEKVKTKRKSGNNTIAGDFCDSIRFVDDLVYFEDYDAFFLYTDSRYFKKLTKREFKKIVLRFCETQYPTQDFTLSIRNDILGLISEKVVREAKKEDTALIAFNDTLYNTRTHTILPFSNEHLCTWSLPYNMSELNMETPVFNEFLKTSIVHKDNHSKHDEELTVLLQEMMGFLMLDSFYATGAFFLYGTGSNGKSVLSSLIEMIFGDEYVSAMALSDFSKPFAVGDIINKRVNISNEEDEKFASSKMFKVLITGESLRGEHKFGLGYKMKSACKFLFSTNKIPTFDGLDHGLKRRIFFIPFYKQFAPKDQDKHLLEKLEAEIPGIIGWALKGAKRLASNNYVFSYSEASMELFGEFEEEMSSALMFFNENYLIDDKIRTTRDEMYEEYLEWAKYNGKRGVVAKKRFIKEIIDNINGIETGLFKTVDNRGYRAFNCMRSNKENREAPPLEEGENNINSEQAREQFPQLEGML